MANPNDGQLITEAWEAYVNQDPMDNIFDRYWLLENLRKGESFEEQHGRAIFTALEYATNTTVKAMSELETLDVNRVDVFDQAEFAWKHIGGDVVMSEFEKAITESGGGKFDLLARKLENLKRSMDNSINAQCFSDGTGTSSKEIGGLNYLVPLDPTSGTVGQINRATFSFWQSQQTSGAQTSTAFDNLQSTLRSIYNLCSNGIGQENPQFVVTDRTVFEGYEGLLQSNERYVRDGAGDKAVSGFKGTQLMFKDVSIAYDNDCTAGYAYVLNRRNLKLVHARWMKMFDAERPTNQFVEVPKVLTIANMATDNPRRLGVVTGIT
tara:strand:- start:309 stop:1277 length:969 start_codon:yes stop_codon:yes gene_type:complete